MRTIDLFAGIGGLRRGFERQGFQTVFANDFEASCKITYDLNYPNTPLTLGDIREINSADLPQYDMLLAGFPCQPFSVAGYRQGFDDEKGRGDLFFYIARILEQTKPMGFVLENVKNLKTHDKGRTFAIIKKTLEVELGYTLKEAVLNTLDYGDIPQNRERIFMVGFQDNAMTERFEFPQKIPLITAFQDLLEPIVADEFYYMGKPLYEKIVSQVIRRDRVYQYRRMYVRENKRGVCPTLTANMGEGGHNVPIILDDKGIRKLTPRECARLQGFDDAFLLPSQLSHAKLYKQMGNSVTVSVVERIAHQVLQAIGESAYVVPQFAPLSTTSIFANC
ncbi:MAG: DNA (cytosine-5-)-methyltransferase [Phototrophicales bacterium]|nr:DNA (cytosine-5-)-methyltransferase [Phototrophicales bacterium]